MKFKTVRKDILDLPSIKTGDKKEEVAEEDDEEKMLHKMNSFINKHSFVLFRCFCKSFQNTSDHLTANSIKDMTKKLKLSASVHIAMKICKQY
jgi:hypothetical protein